MHDAVAEILEERQRISRRDPTGLIASIALHGIVAALLAGSFRGSSRDQIQQILTVRLARAGAPAVSTAPAAPVAPQVSPPAAVEKAPVLEDSEPKTSAAPSLFGRSDKKPATSVTKEPSPSAAAASTTTSSSVPAIGAAGVAGLEGGDFPYTIYIERMITLIGQHWFRPQARGEMLVQIYFAIERDGAIRDAKIETSSGSSSFDRAALRAVLETNPLPPLPFAYNGNYLGVHLMFH